MAVEAEKVPHPDVRKVAKTSAPLRVEKIGKLREILGHLAEKRGTTADFFTDNRADSNRTGLERSSVIQELIEWNEGVPIGATDHEIAFVLKRNRTTVANHKKRLAERREKETLRTMSLGILDKQVEEPVIDLFIYNPTSKTNP